MYFIMYIFSNATNKVNVFLKFFFAPHREEGNVFV